APGLRPTQLAKQRQIRVVGGEGMLCRAHNRSSHEPVDDGEQPMPPRAASPKGERHLVKHNGYIVAPLQADPETECQVHALPAVHMRDILNQKITRSSER